MGQKNMLERILLLLLLIAFIFGTWAIVTALDRQSKALIDLRKALEDSSVFTGNPVSRTTETAAAVNPVSGPRPGISKFYAEDASRGGTFCTAISTDVGSLNPVTSNDTITSQFLGLCNSPLGTRNYADPSVFDPVVAESWTVSPDGKVITIQLRHGVMWQDFVDPESGEKVLPKEVTAEDFVFYLETIRNPEVNAAALRNYYQDLDTIKALSSHTLELRWKNEYYRSLELSLSIFPLPRHFYCPGGRAFDPAKFNDDHQRNGMIVGCGPYKLAERVRNQHYVFRRFHGYFGESLGIAPAIETVRYEIVNAENTRFQMLLAGTLDDMGLTPEQWDNRSNSKPFSQSVLTLGQNSDNMPLKAGETLRRVKFLAPSYYYIGYNEQNPLFADKRVRQALTMLCNRERILKDVYRNEGKIISGPFFYDSPYYDHNVKPWPFDPVAAAEKLKEAGWIDHDGDGILDKDGKKFVFTASQVSGNALQEKMLSIFKEDLAKAGIDMKIAVYEWPVYIEKLEKRSYEVCSLGWSMPYESDPYQVWHSTQVNDGGSNHIGFCNPEADKLIEAIRRTFDVTKRVELCHKFHALIHEEQPYTFLVIPQSLRAVSGKCRNVEIFPMGMESTCFWMENRNSRR